MWIVVGAGVANMLACIFGCKPISASWRPSPGAKCISLMDLSLYMAIINTVTDFLMFVLPIPMVWKLKVPKRKKFATWAVLSLGGL